MTEQKDYKDSLNLPKTSFPMKGNLPEKEPQQIKAWADASIYEKVLEKNKSKKSYILHDGPPYANGDIHMGTALNKILKDIVVRYKNMSDFYSPYLPGWDCHGLPIELQVEKKFGKSKNTEELLAKCRAYAREFIDRQRNSFKRLGIYGEWEKPYLTMNKSYEADIIREFAKVVSSGSVYRAEKPVYWCADCVTALAEAEVEYKEHGSNSIFVKFAAEDKLKLKLGLKKEQKLFAVIWTTTPWTLPANLAISLNPDYKYGLFEHKDSSEVWIVAEELIESFMKETGLEEKDIKKISSHPGSIFENYNCKHPFLNKDSKLINGDHVTLESGTGCVHTAPGHGTEDYIIGKKYGLDIYNPVDDSGKFYKDTTLVGGLKVEDANKVIIDELKKNGMLIYSSQIKHSYPHCWRCKSPIIFRSTPQWFISMDNTGIRKRALAEIEKAKWTPQKGIKRIYSMVENRPDWCISRQRMWGVPIPSFICKDCGDSVLEEKIINSVADMVEASGIEAWHNKNVSELIPKGTKCNSCSSSDFKKGNDILDVWFDSGVSYAAVCEKDERMGFPVDLYLEGSDQHRGWFHTALLQSVATRERAPYKQVVTHGFIVDKDGYKMSKSMGNAVDPSELIKKSGADILRLWVSYEDFSEDISYSDESYIRVTEAYRRIRNTFRFILGNISDFDPKKDSLNYDELREIDKWLIHRLNRFLEASKKAYDDFEFYKVFHLMHNFCVVELSSLYLDISKDALYASKPASKIRRAIQTTMHEAINTMLKVFAPIMPFTTEEAFLAMPHKKEDSIHLCSIPDVDKKHISDEIERKWSAILEFREEVSRALEEARKSKTIGHSLDADLELTLNDDLYKTFTSLDMDPSTIFIVSNTDIKKGDNIKIEVKKSPFRKCARCWQYKKEVGTIKGYEDICQRCKNEIS